MSEAGARLMSDYGQHQSSSLECFSFRGRVPSVFSGNAKFDPVGSILGFLSSVGFFVSLLFAEVFGPAFYFPLIFSLVPSVWIGAAYLARRAHDIGWSARWPLFWQAFGICLLAAAFWVAMHSNKALAIIPFLIAGLIQMLLAGIIFATPGTPGPNRFGPDPREAK